MNQKNNNPLDWPIDNLGTEEAKPNEKQVKDMIILNDYIWAAFNTSQGKKVLEFLVEKYENPRSHYPEMGQDGVLYTYMRGGQVSVVRDILRRIKQSETQRRKKDDRTNTARTN